MKEYITAKEAATITDLATNTLTLAAQRGEVKGFKQGGKWLLSVSSVMDLQKKPHKKGIHRSKNEPIKNRLGEPDYIPNEQMTIYDLEPTYMPKHAKEPIDWKDLPRFTYQDLLEQYNRGIEEGKRIAKQEIKQC